MFTSFIFFYYKPNRFREYNLEWNYKCLMSFMSDTVFILCAGSSKSAGAPLMADFLDTSYKLLKLWKVSEAKEDFEKVFDAKDKLQ